MSTQRIPNFVVREKPGMVGTLFIDPECTGEFAGVFLDEKRDVYLIDADPRSIREAKRSPLLKGDDVCTSWNKKDFLLYPPLDDELCSLKEFLTAWLAAQPPERRVPTGETPREKIQREAKEAALRVLEEGLMEQIRLVETGENKPATAARQVVEDVQNAVREAQNNSTRALFQQARAEDANRMFAALPSDLRLMLAREFKQMNVPVEGR